MSFVIMDRLTKSESKLIQNEKEAKEAIKQSIYSLQQEIMKRSMDVDKQLAALKTDINKKGPMVKPERGVGRAETMAPVK